MTVVSEEEATANPDDLADPASFVGLADSVAPSAPSAPSDPSDPSDPSAPSDPKAASGGDGVAADATTNTDREAAGNALEESAFAVDGMFCAGCAATVERALRRLPGVHDVSVSFLSDSAFVRHERGHVGRADLVRRLAELGHETRAIGERDAAAAQGAFLKSHRIRLAIAAGFGMWVMLTVIARYFTELPDAAFAWWLAVASGVLSLPVLLYSGGPFHRLGWRGLRSGVPGMESLILIATVAAVGVSVRNLAHGISDVWFEVPVMLIVFQLVARLGDFGARRRAADAVRAMLDLSPERVRRLSGVAAGAGAGTGAIAGAGRDTSGGAGREASDDTRVPRDERFVDVAIGELAVGDLIESRAGERLAADGTVERGSALIDAALLSGESLPRSVGPGDAVLAGTLNVDGTLRVRVGAASGERTLDRLAATVGRALHGKSDLMRMIDRVAAWLIPGIGVAALLAFGLALAIGESGTDALVRALAVLVVSCPCALSLAVPLVVSTAASSAAREGIVLRDAAALERADRLDTVLLDKTGTLTTGRLAVVRVLPEAGVTEGEVLALATLAEHGSNHPLARAVIEHAMRTSDAVANTDVGSASERHERAGAGVRARLVDGRTLLAGSARWLAEHGVEHAPAAHDASCSRVLVAVDDRAIGAIELADTVREDVAPLLASLRAHGLEPVLASGDTAGATVALAERFGLAWHAPLDPDAKRALVESLRGQGRRVAFVGDGLNDAPALAAADLGIATGEASDLARSAAAMSVLNGGLERIDVALGLARRSARALRRNLVLAIGYNTLLVPAALLGFLHPLLAVFAMLASSLSISLSSLALARRAGPRGRADEERSGTGREDTRQPSAV